MTICILTELFLIRYSLISSSKHVPKVICLNTPVAGSSIRFFVSSGFEFSGVNTYTEIKQY